MLNPIAEVHDGAGVVNPYPQMLLAFSLRYMLHCRAPARETVIVTPTTYEEVEP
jgi:hypothetical protein